MNFSHLQYITPELEPQELRPHLERMCNAGLRWVQLRIKQQSADTVLAMATEAAQICRQFGTVLIINDHPAVARACGANGVHIGKEDMPLAEARALLGAGSIIGCTANTLEDMRLLAKSGADYIGCGPYQFTTTKQNLSPIVGLVGYRERMDVFSKEHSNTPVVAVGGITLDDIGQLAEVGLHGVAVSSALTQHPKPEVFIRLVEQAFLKND